MQSVLLRVMLAVLTAVWSPVWCCCFQRVLAADAPKTMACHAPAAAKAEHSNCHRGDGKSPADQHTPAPTQPSACACSTTPAEKPAPAADVVAVAAVEWVIADLSPRVVIAEPIAHVGLPLEQPAPPPPASLLRLHCALLV